MRRIYFSVFGALTLFLGPASFVNFSPGSPVQAVRNLILLFAVELLGFGLVRQRKWAALYFSVPLCWIGLRQTFASLSAVPFNVPELLYGFSLLFPLIVTIRYWRQLTWNQIPSEPEEVMFRIYSPLEDEYRRSDMAHRRSRDENEQNALAIITDITRVDGFLFGVTSIRADQRLDREDR